MDRHTLIHEHPYLLSPAHLAVADTAGKWQRRPHLMKLNELLLKTFWAEPEEDANTLMCNMQGQVGKSDLASKYFPAWALLVNPDIRILLAAHEEKFAVNRFGKQVKEIIDKWGGDLGVRISEDTQAKGEWGVEGAEGGMICRGIGGGLTGRPADIFLIDDPIKDAIQAMSPTQLQNQWDWFDSVVAMRRRVQTKIIVVMTRWSKNDLCGRILKRAKETGEKWTHVKFKALAEHDDPLGRKIGEPLWPEQISLQHVLNMQKTSRWWSSNWQQDPADEEGALFRPSQWPEWTDMGDAWSLPDVKGGMARRIHRRSDVIRLITVDWASSGGRDSDCTAMLVFGLTPDGKILILDIFNERIRLEECANSLARMCRKWRPSVVAAEANGFQASLLMECRRHHEIPEIRKLHPEGKAKVMRAYPAIVAGENGRIYLPPLRHALVSLDPNTLPTSESLPDSCFDQSWRTVLVDQLAGFTGNGDEQDDLVDCMAYAGMLANTLRGPMNYDGEVPCMLTPGKECW